MFVALWYSLWSVKTWSVKLPYIKLSFLNSILVQKSNLTDSVEVGVFKCCVVVVGCDVVVNDDAVGCDVVVVVL